jgi:hypothetical protein
MKVCAESLGVAGEMRSIRCTACASVPNKYGIFVYTRIMLQLCVRIQ